MNYDAAHPMNAVLIIAQSRPVFKATEILLRYLYAVHYRFGIDRRFFHGRPRSINYAAPGCGVANVYIRTVQCIGFLKKEASRIANRCVKERYPAIVPTNGQIGAGFATQLGEYAVRFGRQVFHADDKAVCPRDETRRYGVQRGAFIIEQATAGLVEAKRHFPIPCLVFNRLDTGRLRKRVRLEKGGPAGDQ